MFFTITIRLFVLPLLTMTAAVAPTTTSNTDISGVLRVTEESPNGPEPAAGDEDYNESSSRVGTTASARFNVLSTMVGGGSLSLPMAFQKSGTLMLGPLIMIAVAMITEFCFRIHVYSARIRKPVGAHDTAKGTDSFESIAAAAFGPKMYVFGAFLVTSMCFFGTVGYAVLLRDMLQPVTDLMWKTPEAAGGPTLHNNLTMLVVVVLVTPLCTLRNLTALERFGAFSMLSVLILGSCVVLRSVQCNLGYLAPNTQDLFLADNKPPTFQLWPDSWKDLLDAFPLYVSCFVCHYNLLPVHNELQRPSDDRVHWWLRSTVWTATLFYLIIGMAGSAYGHCTSTGKVQGNVLLDFAADDPLLMVGRMCLALTLTMAFPMLTIPGRDILIRSLAAMPRRGRRVGPLTDSSATVMTSTTQATLEVSNTAFLQEPLLENDHLAMDEEDQQGAPHGAAADNEPSTAARLLAAILVLWSAAAVASFCKSIDVVWDLLGSSLSCLLSFLIPCGAYLMIAAEHDQGSRLSKVVAGLLLAIFTPLMIVSTTNAVINTFFA